MADTDLSLAPNEDDDIIDLFDIVDEKSSKNSQKATDDDDFEDDFLSKAIQQKRDEFNEAMQSPAPTSKVDDDVDLMSDFDDLFNELVPEPKKSTEAESDDDLDDFLKSLSVDNDLSENQEANDNKGSNIDTKVEDDLDDLADLDLFSEADSKESASLTKTDEKAPSADLSTEELDMFLDESTSAPNEEDELDIDDLDKLFSEKILDEVSDEEKKLSASLGKGDDEELDVADLENLFKNLSFTENDDDSESQEKTEVAEVPSEDIASENLAETEVETAPEKEEDADAAYNALDDLDDLDALLQADEENNSTEEVKEDASELDILAGDILAEAEITGTEASEEENTNLNNIFAQNTVEEEIISEASTDEQDSSEALEFAESVEREPSEEAETTSLESVSEEQKEEYFELATAEEIAPEDETLAAINQHIAEEKQKISFTGNIFTQQAISVSPSLDSAITEEEKQQVKDKQEIQAVETVSETQEVNNEEISKLLTDFTGLSEEVNSLRLALQDNLDDGMLLQTEVDNIKIEMEALKAEVDEIKLALANSVDNEQISSSFNKAEEGIHLKIDTFIMDMSDRFDEHKKSLSNFEARMAKLESMSEQMEANLELFRNHIEANAALLQRVDSLEESIANLDNLVANAAAKVIREEIVSLFSEDE